MPTPLSKLYDLATGDEDARVCKDIPETACKHLPRNFFAYLSANTLTKIADELTSARIIMPWLLGTLGASSTLVGFIVPMREAGVLLPQLFVAAVIRTMPVRKTAWIVGAVASALALLALGIIVLNQNQQAAGGFILAAFLVYSLARGICSVAAKDVLGKAVSKSRRGALMGYAASISSGFTLLFGVGLILLPNDFLQANNHTLFAAFFLIATALWFIAAAVFFAIREHAGSVEGGGNAIATAFKSLSLVKTDKAFRDYVIARALLLSLALMPPFVVLTMQASLDAFSLGYLIIANGLAGMASGIVWGKLSDYSSRLTMVITALLAAAIGFVFWYLATNNLFDNHNWLLALIFFGICIAHAGARLGRKTYLVDMANSDNRAQYVAVGNTIIGGLMLVSGAVGVIAEVYSPALTVLLLAAVALVAGLYTLKIKDVSE